MKKTNPISFLFFFFLCATIFAQSPPNTNNDNITVELNQTLSVTAPGVLANDTDDDGDTLNVTQFTINGTTYNAGQTANFTEGNFTMSDNGGFTCSPTIGYIGNYPPITYTVSDGLNTNTAQLFIDVINTTNFSPPVANTDVDTAEINTTLTVTAPGLLANDTDPDGDTLSILTFTVNGSTYPAGFTANLAEGNLTINADGSYSFVPTPGYTGPVPDINYTIYDGLNTATGLFLLTVERITNLLDIELLNSCNQGYTFDGDYKIKYTVRLRNTSNARDYHANNLIRDINLTDNLQAVFGNGCVTLVDDIVVSMSPTIDYVNNPYPMDWDVTSFNNDFENITSNEMFNSNAINNNVLYPRQSITVIFCVTFDPVCDGRPNPTPSGSGIDFDNIINVTSSIGNDTSNYLATDFHMTETSVAANLYVPEPSPEVNPDGSYDYVNTVIITNEGPATANNVNYNMGLGRFIDNGIVFTDLIITQVSGPPVTINSSYNGDTDSKLLAPNTNLAASETIILEVYYEIGTISSIDRNYFLQMGRSMTQGGLDSFDETTPFNLRRYSFVIWSDALGDHLDRYYVGNAADDIPTSNDQCDCFSTFMLFNFISSATSEKTITTINDAPNGILEHTEITFQITATNTSTAVQIENLQIVDDLNSICSGNIVSVSNPTILSSTALTNPVLNPNFDGITDINILNGTSGILEPNQNVVIEFSVIFNDDCIGINNSTFTAVDPLNNLNTATGSVNVDVFSDNDNDGITNLNDIDDDNDTIPDTIEYNGQDPLADDDLDLIPNYRDTGFGADSNSDGIIDVFDFDFDGVPNHFDLDSDNDGIFDISEASNTALDTDADGITNSPVGTNGLDNTVETNDSFFSSITYIIPNTDSTGNDNYLDIDADNDGIVDNIEGQATDSYIPPNNSIDANGIDSAYQTGINPVDTEADGIPDYIDTNSDGDIRNDIIEGWDSDSDGTPETTPSNNDADSDGLDDAFDNNDSQVNPTNGQVPTDFPNADNAATPERDWREIIAIVIIIDDVSVIEGGNLTFTIILTTLNNNSILIPSATPINITFNTADGTATSPIYYIAITPFDYNQVSAFAFIIPPLQTSAQFSVSTLDDNIYELDELLTLTGTITSNNTITTSIEGIGTILDNETAPDISMNDTRENEGVDLVHTITMSHPSSTPTEINISTSDIIAISPDDYAAIASLYTIDGTIDPASPNLDVTFNITTNIDNLNEPDEEALAVIGQVTSNNVGIQDLNKTGTILDIDPDPTIIINDDIVVEGNPLIFNISMVNASGEPMQNYEAVDLAIRTNNETATAPEDYASINTTTTIPALTESIIIEVTTIDDNLNEDTEFMNLGVGITSNNVTNLPPYIEGLGTIKDNDIPNLFSPNGDGESETFAIAGLQDFPEFTIIIYDRWGSEVYNYNNNGNTNPLWWDGTYNGNPVPTGVYFYTLNYNDGITKPKTSFIELIR
ncbi:MAG: gliding motility-associated C-terminal domain-containing protein [Urechidicola sp.]|nr:gliding motility-associated C-terminal domain-containing protein [Urechidicola sp.]